MKGKRMPVAKVSQTAKPKALTGKLKQTEGDTPRSAMATGKQAGMLGAKRREKRLANVPM